MQISFTFLAGPSQMYVTWLTHEQPSGPPVVEYGIQSGKYELKKHGNMTKFTTAYSRYIYRVALEDLKPNTTYCNNPTISISVYNLIKNFFYQNFRLPMWFRTRIEQ